MSLRGIGRLPVVVRPVGREGHQSTGAHHSRRLSHQPRLVRNHPQNHAACDHVKGAVGEGQCLGGEDL